MRLAPLRISPLERVVFFLVFLLAVMERRVLQLVSVTMMVTHTKRDHLIHTAVSK